jgi:hypothetical protein
MLVTGSVYRASFRVKRGEDVGSIFRIFFGVDNSCTIQGQSLLEKKNKNRFLYLD